MKGTVIQRLFPDCERYDEYYKDTKGHTAHGVNPKKVKRWSRYIPGIKAAESKPPKKCKRQTEIEKLLDQLQSKNFVEIQCEKPFNYRKQLYEGCRRWGYSLRFATTDRSVIVYK